MNFQLLKSTPLAALLVCFWVLQPGQVLARTTKIVITATSGVINFGSFSVLASCSNCSITISPAGVRSVIGGIVLSNLASSSAATFSVAQTCNPGTPSGCEGYTPVLAATAALPAGGVSMTLGTFTSLQSGGTGNNVSAFTNILSVGATLTIPSQGAAGTFGGGGFTVTTNP